VPKTLLIQTEQVTTSYIRDSATSVLKEIDEQV